MGADVMEKHVVWPQLNKGEDVMKKLAGHNILKDGYNNRSIAILHNEWYGQQSHVSPEHLMYKHVPHVQHIMLQLTHVYKCTIYTH